MEVNDELNNNADELKEVASDKEMGTKETLKDLSENLEEEEKEEEQLPTGKRQHKPFVIMKEIGS